MVTGFSLQQVKPLSEFDPTHQLEQAALNSSLESELSWAVQHYSINVLMQKRKLAHTVVHFTQPNCTCQLLAQPHVDQVKALAEKHQFDNLTIDITTAGAQSINQLIPSTPAIAVFNANAKLIYMGPYSSGYFCTEGAGLAEPFITLSQNQTRTLPAVISQSKGCYCHRIKP